MYLAYFDESGDPGTGSGSPTSHFVLSCLLLNHGDWLPTLNKLIKMRQRLRERFGIRANAELKGTHFTQGSGPFSDVSMPRRQRMWLYRKLQIFQSKLPIKVFAVSVDKASATWEPKKAAWTFAIQRVHRFCKELDDSAMLFPDEGQGAFIRRRVRAMRRHHLVPSFYGGQAVRLDTDRIIEDPNDRDSSQSYLIQLCDWNAYAAHRSQYVDPRPGVDGGLWDALGGVLLEEVNKLRASRGSVSPAIVKHP